MTDKQDTSPSEYAPVAWVSADALERCGTNAPVAATAKMYSKKFMSNNVPLYSQDTIQALIAERDEWKSMFNECAEARDASGFLGTVPECIQHWSDIADGAETAFTTARNEAIEECAKVCAERSGEFEAMKKSDPSLKRYKSDTLTKALVWGQASCILRALKDKT